MTERQEKKNELVAFLTTVGIHAVALLLMFFIVAWRPMNPPPGEYGVELNFGLDDQGSGDIQPETPVGSGGTQEEEPQKSEPQTSTPPPAQTTTPAEDKMLTTDEDDAPVIEKKEDKKTEIKKEEVKKEEVKTVEPPKEKVIEKPKEVKKEETPKKEEPKAVYNPNAQNTASSNKTSEGKAGQPGNHGDDEGKVGDKGSPEGKLDAKALYGQPGGGGGNGTGSSLTLSGWDWDEVPKPVVPNNESGKIVFEIVVNADGELEKISILENSLSAEAAKACRQAVERLTFTKTGTNVPTLSKGKITFLVRAK
ncbi:energy transducer TonB [Ohtaekwangia sp.]|uniref:energy transducer TonB n=1 Tax=Ohtaekwangia sp. TaxID=2066019 RepID=UPI002F95C096